MRFDHVEARCDQFIAEVADWPPVRLNDSMIETLDRWTLKEANQEFTPRAKCTAELQQRNADRAGRMVDERVPSELREEVCPLARTTTRVDDRSLDAARPRRHKLTIRRMRGDLRENVGMTSVLRIRLILGDPSSALDACRNAGVVCEAS